MKIIISILALFVVFFGYVASKDAHFSYSRSAVINTTPEKLFPLISSFAACAQWNPYDQKDSNMKRTIHGTDGQVGSIMEFDGNKDVGSGSLEIIRVIPNQSLALRLKMLKPFRAENLVEYQLMPEGAGTRFTWKMSGDGGFMGKLMSTFIDCEKMVTKDFEIGIENLKKLAEK